jgi:hypothetical protein
MKHLPRMVGAAALLLASTALQAKLPAPSDEAKAKAAEAAAKTAHGTKVANFQLCKSMDKVAAGYFAQAKKDGKAVKPAEKLDACADPGAFVYTPPVPPAAPGAAPVAAAPAAGPAVANAAAPAAPKK